MATSKDRCIPDLQKCGLGDRYASEAGADTERVVVNLDGLGSGTNNQMLPIHPENGSAPFWVLSDVDSYFKLPPYTKSPTIFSWAFFRLKTQW